MVLIRAAWREVEREAPSGWDYIFVARARTTGAKMQQVREVMSAQLRRATAPSPGRDRLRGHPAAAKKSAHAVATGGRSFFAGGY